MPANINIHPLSPPLHIPGNRIDTQQPASSPQSIFFGLAYTSSLFFWFWHNLKKDDMFVATLPINDRYGGFEGKWVAVTQVRNTFRRRLFIIIGRCVSPQSRSNKKKQKFGNERKRDATDIRPRFLGRPEIRIAYRNLATPLEFDIRSGCAVLPNDTSGWYEMLDVIYLAYGSNYLM